MYDTRLQDDRSKSQSDDQHPNFSIYNGIKEEWLQFSAIIYLVSESIGLESRALRFIGSV